LKLYTDFFRKGKKVSTENIDSIEKLSKFFSQKILRIEGFEEKLFDKLFMEGKVVILFDAVDEISPSFKDFVIELMKGVHEKTLNPLWTSTRPHLSEEITQNIKPFVVNFLPMTNKEIQEFFAKILEIKGFRIEDHLKVSTRLRKIMPIFKDPFRNPLLMKILIEALDSESDIRLINLYEIYDKIVTKMFQNCVGKGQENLRFLSNSIGDGTIIEIIEKNAFVKYFKKNYCGDEAFITEKIQTLLNLHFQGTDQLPFEHILRLGILSDSGLSDFVFIHQTFAEFFIAEFLLQQIFHKKSENIESFAIAVEIFEICVMNRQFQMILNFLDSALIKFDHRHFVEFENFKRTFNEIFKGKPYLTILVDLGHEKLFVNLVHKFVENFREDFLFQKDLVYISAVSCSLELNKIIWELMKIHLSTFEIKNIFEGNNILKFSVKNKSKDVFDFYLNVYRAIFSEEEMKVLLISEDNGVESVLKMASKLYKNDQMQTLFSNIDKPIEDVNMQE
jgi:hypothetical protein